MAILCLLFLSQDMLKAEELETSGLKWETIQYEETLLPNEKIGYAVFPFVNTSDDVVVITKVEPSCGCMSEALEEVVYEPGQRGQLKVNVKLKTLDGNQTGHVKVQTNGEYWETLKLNFLIKKLVSIKPKMLVWGGGSKVEEKKITLTLLEELNALPKDIELKYDKERVQVVRVDNVEKNRVELKLLPLVVESDFSEIVHVTVKGFAQQLSFYLYQK